MDELRTLVRLIEQQSGGISNAQGQGSQEQRQTATARVKVGLGNETQRVLEFPLKQEHGLWKVSCLDPLRALAAG